MRTLPTLGVTWSLLGLTFGLWAARMAITFAPTLLPAAKPRIEIDSVSGSILSARAVLLSSVTNLNATHGIVAADGAFCTGSNALNGSIRFRNKAAFDAWYASRIHSKAQTGQVPIQVAMRQSRIGQTADGETMVVASINPESSRYAITLRVVQLAAAPQSS